MRPYAGQIWANGLMEQSPINMAAFLQLIARDLATDARENDVTASNLELWENTDGSKGLFMGDTSSLPADGWTKLGAF